MSQPPTATDPRAEAGLSWARRQLAEPALALEPLAGDASFRRYFRLRRDDDSWVLMDAPPEREDCGPFLDVARRLSDAGVRSPRIESADPDMGYLLLEDLGDELLRDHLDPDTVDEHFPRLFRLLRQLGRDAAADGLPAYDRPLLRRELDLFPDWYLNRHKGVLMDAASLDAWEALVEHLLLSAESQRQVFVHRDFHSCNLLLPPDGGIAVIDFQDAVHGPVSYDFASLVWDRYIAWPRDRLEAWMEDVRPLLSPDTSAQAWVRDVDWMGLQRNLKIVGIFARLHYRDGKAGYLDMIPRFWSYVRDVLSRYPEFTEFDDLLERLSCAP